MLAELGAWWAQQMLDLLPARLRQLDAQAGDALVIEPAGTAIDLTLRRNGRLSRLGQFTLDPAGRAALGNAVANRPHALILSLPGGFLLEKALALPLAAERDLAGVLAFEMDRETPFSVDEVYWDWRIAQRDRAQGRLHVVLSLVPKAPLAELIEALGRADLAPTALHLIAADGETREIGMQSIGAGRRGPALQAVPLAGFAVAALGLTALVLPFLLQALALGEVDRRIAALKPDVATAEDLRRRIEGGGAGSDALSAERARVGDVLKALAATTSVLPDDTHLTDLTLHQRKLGMLGQSGAAARLIGALAADPTFKDPAFAAPVTRMDGGKIDVFAITAEVVP